ncbi:MAG: SDR family oxidoreductase, partial [Bacteroidia bacterium]|nr:SDR family oxidoreductase [Bacteroidia bacterium]
EPPRLFCPVFPSNFFLERIQQDCTPINFNLFNVVEDFFNYADKQSPLGNATAEECADYCITLFSDLTRKVTMQNLYHDGGYSTTGVSAEQLAGN